MRIKYYVPSFLLKSLRRFNYDPTSLYMKYLDFLYILIILIPIRYYLAIPTLQHVHASFILFIVVTKSLACFIPSELMRRFV